MATLTVHDDGFRSGEVFRLRSDRFQIGRDEGDFVLPFDLQMSGSHVAICRELVDAQFDWSVRDLDSTNGTFFKIDNAKLKHGNELIIGGSKFRFDAAPVGAAAASQAPQRQATAKFVSPVSAAARRPALFRIHDDIGEEKLLLPADDVTVGGGQGEAAICFDSDPFADAIHCRIYKDENGNWQIENQSETNGTWLRRDRIDVKRTCAFQAGEQRFTLAIC